MGNIFTPEGAETTTIDIVDDIITLFDGSVENIVSRTLVIHEGEDDLGDGGDEGSSKTGNAGSRVACGIVESRTLNCATLCDELTGHVAAAAVVRVVGSSEDSPVGGNVVLIQGSADSGVYVFGGIYGLGPGPHGFHIHEIGSTDGKYITFYTSPYQQDFWLLLTMNSVETYVGTYCRITKSHLLLQMAARLRAPTSTRLTTPMEARVTPQDMWATWVTLSLPRGQDPPQLT